VGGRTTKDFVESVRAAGDLVRVVSDYVPLKQAGARHKGLCPFHQEKTPSFSVDPNAQLFYCFGCQTGGDLFKFVMLYEKVDFPEAVEMLARRFGVPVPTSGPCDSRLDRINQAVRLAETFYRESLGTTGGKRCRDYLEKRGIDTQVADTLSLGYAPDSWDALRNHLVSKGFKPEEMLAAGLVIARKDESGTYDRFRNRLIFPIRDASGRTLAFGGRALDDQQPKYLNSPETPAYTKGNHLYGLDLARDAVRREGFVIVVEGYLDLAALLQAGFANAVASLGTALTPGQAQMLSRYANRVLVSYDGDSAGTAATVRSLDLLLDRGFEVNVVDLPDKHDPDDYIRKEGAPAFGDLVSNAPSYLGFLVEREARNRDLDRPEERVAAVNAVLPHVARLKSAVERAAWSGRLADALHIEDDLVLQELNAVLRSGRTQIRHRVRDPKEPPREVESRLVSLMLRYEHDRTRAQTELEPSDLEGTRVGGIVHTIMRLVEQGQGVDYPNVFAALEHDEERDLLTRIAFREDPEGGTDELDDCIRSLRKKRLVRERRELQKQIQTAADAAAIDSLLDRTQQLARQIEALS
jgi:DNA primase